MTKAATSRAMMKCWKFCRKFQGATPYVIGLHLDLHLRTAQRLVKRMEDAGYLKVVTHGPRRQVFYAATSKQPK